MNKLNFNKLAELEQELNERVTVEVLGGRFTVEVDKVFRTTKIENMILDFVKFLQRVSKEVDEIDEDMVKRFTRINQVLILKHFTNIEVPDDDLKMVKMCEILLDLGILDEIEEIIPKSELDKLNEVIEDRLKSMKNVQSMYGELLLNQGE